MCQKQNIVTFKPPEFQKGFKVSANYYHYIFLFNTEK